MTGFPSSSRRDLLQHMAERTVDIEILTLPQVAGFLKVTDRTIYRLVAARKIPAFKVGGTWRFSAADIQKWIAQQSAANNGQESTTPMGGKDE
jgi:excisionase family DNA binding protein